MTAKEYLSQAKKLRIKIEQKERLLKELQEKALCNGSQDVKSDKVQTSTSNGKMENNVVQYVDLGNEIKDMQSVLDAMNEKIAVASGKYASVVIARREHDMTYRQISKKLHLSVGSTKNYEKIGMDLLQEHLEK